MNENSKKENQNNDEVEEGEVPDDSPLDSASQKITPQPLNLNNQSSSNEIIFQTVVDADIQADKKRKKIYKQQKVKRFGVPTKEKEKVVEKEKKNERTIAVNKNSQQRDHSESYTPSSFGNQNQSMKQYPNYQQPNHPPQPYYTPNYMYPMMPQINAPPIYPPYGMGPYIPPSLPQPYGFNMMGMPHPQPNLIQMQQPGMMMNMPMGQSGMVVGGRMPGPQSYPQNNNIHHYQYAQKQKMQTSNQYQPFSNQPPRKEQVNYHESHQVEKQQYNNNLGGVKVHKIQNEVQNVSVQKQQNRVIAEKNEKINELNRRRNYNEQTKSCIKKQLKIFSYQQQLQILQIIKFLSNYTAKMNTPQYQEGQRVGYDKNLNQLQMMVEQNEEKRQSVYKILEVLQMQWTLMKMKQAKILSWAMKDAQFVKMGEIMEETMNTPLGV